MRPEYIFCSVWEGNSPPILIVLIYRPLDVLIRSDPRLFTLLRSTCPEFSNKIIMGDLNADTLCNTNSDTKCIRDLMDELSLSLVNTGPTHHSSSTDTWIDILLVDQCETVVNSSRVSPPIVSRHDKISVTIKLFLPTISSNTVTYVLHIKISLR